MVLDYIYGTVVDPFAPQTESSGYQRGRRAPDGSRVYNSARGLP